MYCPQCGTESGSGLQYCRSCGANLKVIGKALSLSEAIARSDRGPLPKIKEMFRNLKVEQVTEEVSGALDRMNKEILKTPPAGALRPFWKREKKTAQERREDHITKGTVSLFSGAGLMIFLYYFSAALVLKLPPNVLAEVPFELEPVVSVIWLFGLIPTLSGFGHLLAGLMIRPGRHANVDASMGGSINRSTLENTAENIPAKIDTHAKVANAANSSLHGSPASVTEHTTNLLGPPD